MFQMALHYMVQENEKRNNKSKPSSRNCGVDDVTLCDLRIHWFCEALIQVETSLTSLK